MTLKEYMELALKTSNHDFGGIRTRLLSSDDKLKVLHALIGLATESGEALDMMKKHVYYGKEFDRVNAIEEIGDIFWYAALALDTLGSSFEEAMEANIKKLEKRYNKGKFTVDEAINRDVKTEVVTLQQALNKFTNSGDNENKE